MGFPEMIRTLEGYGVADVLLPFILVFTLIYAILQKTHILGPEGKDKQFNVIVAFVMAMAVVIPHVLNMYPPGADVVNIMNTALPNVSIMAIAILMVMILLGLFGAKIGLGNGLISGWMVALAFIIVGYIFGASAGWWGSPNWLWQIIDEETKNLLIIVLVFGIIIWFITKEEKPAGSKSFVEKFNDIIKPN